MGVIRAVWFASTIVGVGFELHGARLDDVAPNHPAAAWQRNLEDTQAVVNAYFRWRR